MTLKSVIARWLPIRDVDAHCDIPCGIYDPVSAKIAAQTVLKMTMRIQAMEGFSLKANDSLQPERMLITGILDNNIAPPINRLLDKGRAVYHKNIALLEVRYHTLTAHTV